MWEKTRAWLTPALLAVMCLLLYRLTEAVEDVADSVEAACVSTEPEDAPAAQIVRAPEGPSHPLSPVRHVVR